MPPVGYQENEQAARALMRRPAARSAHSDYADYPPDAAPHSVRTDGWQAGERGAPYPYPPVAPLPQRATAAPSRPLRAGQPPASRQGTGRPPPPPTEPTPGWRRWAPILSGVLAGVVVVAIALAVLVFLRGQQPAPTTGTLPSPTPTAQKLCADLLTQRYSAAYSLLTPSLQRQGTEAQYVASQRELDALQGRVTVCAVGRLSAAGTTASGALNITRAHAHATQATLSLAWSGSAWQVSAYDTSMV